MIVAVIPCYNEAVCAPEIVRQAKAFVDKVIVVDDASCDDTRVLCSQAGAQIVVNMVRKGFGYSVVAGIAVACSDGADIVVTLDGDGQHDPNEIQKLLLPIVDGYADLVIGSRFLGDYEIPFYRKKGIDVITWLYNVGHKQKITDGQSCFRAYSRALLDAVDTREWGFVFSTEVLIRARKQGWRIAEVPIRCIYHDKLSMNSTMHPIPQGIAVAFGTLKWRWRLKK